MTLSRTGGRKARPRPSRAASGAGGRASPASEEHGPPPLFGEWLRVQLRARRMSQRQLAARSGVDHATVSRLLNEDREPSLDTAMKLAQVLFELGHGTDEEQYLALLSGIGAGTPAKRVEHALRADGALDEIAVRRVMDYYIGVRRTAARSRDQSA
jgi:transcriptional regulator with XRE-family HTH domain